MRGMVVVASLLLLATAGQSAMAQGISVGPGGVRIYEDRGPPPPPPYGGPRYDDRGYGPPPPPPPPGYGGPRGGGGQVCAYENGFCNFRGSAVVRYGARGVYVAREARNGIPCNNRVFGDPTPGLPKRCIID